jgi:hypothetical protein
LHPDDATERGGLKMGKREEKKREKEKINRIFILS